MTPESIAAELRVISGRILRSVNPSRSAVAAAIRRVLSTVEGIQASPSTKVVVNEGWSLDDASNVFSEHGGVSLRQGFYGEYAVEMPADEAAHFQADAGDGTHVSNSWRDLVKEGGDPDYGYEPVEGFP
jgi:hypothetical protein